MHHHEANPVGVCKSLEPGNDLVVVSVAVAVPTDLPDLLERVYDDQRGVWMLSEKPGELFVQAIAKLLGWYNTTTGNCRSVSIPILI